jgi:hypothetical protein
MLPRLRLYAVNTFIAAFLLLLAIDVLPSAPKALQRAIQPLMARLGLDQGPFALFAPHPDSVNTRLRAEIKYADGQTAEWTSPAWRDLPLSQRFVRYRHQEWLDHMALRPDPALEPWCRYLARSARPDLPNADRGAEVRLIAEEALVPSPADRPWTTWRELPPFRDGIVLSLEYLR